MKFVSRIAAPKLALLSATLLCLPAMYGQALVFSFETQLPLSDPCAVFNAPTSDPTITRIVYGEPINFAVKGTNQAIFVTGSDGQINLKFEVITHGDGVGQTSGIKYQFHSKVLLKANTNGANPTDPNFVFNGKFKVDARIIGQGNAASSGVVAQGAQDNALLHFYITVHYASNSIQTLASSFTLECVASPWTNQMTNPQGSSKTAVGRGFGDPWNKYSWSMKDFNGGMIVGTKNGFFNFNALVNPTQAVTDCENNPNLVLPSAYKGLACLELFSPGVDAQTRYAEIWRFDYVKKSWTKVRDDGQSQGFRIMEVHGGKLYVGSDLGSFVLGTDLTPGLTGPWNFPGSQLLVSVDGKSFNPVTCPAPPTGPCNSATGALNSGAVNISFRSLASFNGKLYLGTFNASGGELWSYNASTGAWALIQKFPGKPAVTELKVYKGSLYIGLGGVPNDDYLWVYNTSGVLSRVNGQPNLNGSGTNIGVLKLFATSTGLLYVGTVDFGTGFNLQQYNATTGVFTTVTDNGFFNSNNAYAWSMNEINGRVFLGTFNADFLTALPRGSAELWYSDDNINWQQMALPLDWGLWNYGIRTMEIGNKQLFLGSASNIVAPDVTFPPGSSTPLSPGTEVWTIRTNTVAPGK